MAGSTGPLRIRIKKSTPASSESGTPMSPTHIRDLNPKTVDTTNDSRIAIELSSKMNTCKYSTRARQGSLCNKCPRCGKAFDSKVGLDNHLDELQCPFTSKSMKDSTVQAASSSGESNRRAPTSTSKDQSAPTLQNVLQMLSEEDEDEEDEEDEDNFHNRPAEEALHIAATKKKAQETEEDKSIGEKSIRVNAAPPARRRTEVSIGTILSRTQAPVAPVDATATPSQITSPARIANSGASATTNSKDKKRKHRQESTSSDDSLQTNNAERPSSPDTVSSAPQIPSLPTHGVELLNNIQAMYSQVQGALEENVECKARLDRQEKTINNEIKRRKKRDKTIKELEETIKELDSEKKCLQSENGQLRAAVQDEKKRVDAETKSKTSVQTRLQQTLEAFGEQSEKNETLQLELCNIKKEKRQVEGRLESLQSQLDKALAELESSKEQNARLEEEKVDLKEKAVERAMVAFRQSMEGL